MQVESTSTTPPTFSYRTKVASSTRWFSRQERQKRPLCCRPPNRWAQERRLISKRSLPSVSPCPIAKYVPHVPVPETHNTVRLKEPRPLCCQSVLDSPSSAACCSPFGSGSSPPPSTGELILRAGPSGADRRGFQAHIYLILDHSAIVPSECRLNWEYIW